MSFTAPVINWAGLGPVLIILGAGLLGVLVEAFVPRRARQVTQTVLSLLALRASGVVLAVRWVARRDPLLTGRAAVRPSGLGEVEDGLSVVAQGVLLVIGFLALLVMADRTTVGDGAFAAQAADRPGSAEESESTRAGWTTTEVFPLALFCLAGLMLFPAVGDLISLFVTLEMVSLPLYVLAATARHRRLLSQEAALKYLVLGAFASALLLMGAALLYGVAGSVDYATISAAMRQAQGGWMSLAGITLVTVGLLFKVAVVPFHAWSPDVYQGAPTPVTGLMAAGVKATAFLALLRFSLRIGYLVVDDLKPVLWALAVLTMLVGTVVGVVQKDVKRLLAYSAIAHAGYMLIAVTALDQVAVVGLVFYALAYGVATVGAFGVVTLVRTYHGGGVGPSGAAGAEATGLRAYRGLARRSPWLAGAMAVFLLSLAGIPLTAGFMGKFIVFLAGVGAGATWIVVVAVASSVATAFFYMRLIVLMFFHDPEDQDVVVVGSTGLSMAAIGLAALLTVTMGVLPQAVLETLLQAAMLIS